MAAYGENLMATDRCCTDHHTRAIEEPANEHVEPCTDARHRRADGLVAADPSRPAA
jgi:hypothetical protein